MFLSIICNSPNCASQRDFFSLLRLRTNFTAFAFAQLLSEILTRLQKLLGFEFFDALFECYFFVSYYSYQLIFCNQTQSLRFLFSFSYLIFDTLLLYSVIYVLKMLASSFASFQNSYFPLQVQLAFWLQVLILQHQRLYALYILALISYDSSTFFTEATFPQRLLVLLWPKPVSFEQRRVTSEYSKESTLPCIELFSFFDRWVSYKFIYSDQELFIFLFWLPLTDYFWLVFDLQLLYSVQFLFPSIKGGSERGYFYLFDDSLGVEERKTKGFPYPSCISLISYFDILIWDQGSDICETIPDLLQLLDNGYQFSLLFGYYFILVISSWTL